MLPSRLPPVWLLLTVALLSQASYAFPQEPSKAANPAATKDNLAGELAPHRVFPIAKIKEEVIGEITTGSVLDTARSTDNHLAWAEKAKDGSRIVRLDGKQLGTTYADLGALQFSADEEHLLWAAKRAPSGSSS